MKADPPSTPLRFIDEPIEPLFDTPPALLKKPGCPDGFVWRGRTFRVLELLAERFDFGRRGTMAHNMTPVHAATAAKRGSWGVGRFFFQVKCEERETEFGVRSPMTEDRGPLVVCSGANAAGTKADGRRTRVFEIYYDRAPRVGGRTKVERDRRRGGSWVLWGEVAPQATTS